MALKTSSRCCILLELVEIVGEVRQRHLEPLPLLGGHADLVGLGALLERIARHLLPVVEHTLREGLSTGAASQVPGEAK